jgi:serine/threonine protein kinase
MAASRATEANENPRDQTRTQITPERFQKIRALFEAVLQVDRERRDTWLREACKNDPALLTSVEELLIANEAAGETDACPISLTVAKEEPVFPRFEGRRIGQYQIISEIGHGGMGSVYLARRADDVFSKQIALKVLRAERIYPALLRRFRQEREIIARLDHPNVARLLDGGTTAEGLPYSVMEYIEGQPIDNYCDRHRLNITARLILFRTVCAAVQYAHQNLVVHRDLKPSNILVTPDGTVKLLDFGIAKLMEADLRETFTDASSGPGPMTPAYASPEQTRGEPISTSSDVYSLGVILYELLTGRWPYRPKGRLPHDVAQAVCEQEPVRPSEAVLQPSSDSEPWEKGPRAAADEIAELREGKAARLQRRLGDELDNIVLMALRKEPERRYRSVEQFSEDIGRHLAGLPVLAQNDTVPYRARKFVKRHRVGVIAAAAVASLMMTSVVATSWEARIARQERTKAQQEAARAERHAREAEAYRQRAEKEAAFALEQVHLVEARTRDANARAKEADFERQRASRRTQQVRDISAALLQLTDDSAAGASQRAMSEVERVLTELFQEGYNDSRLIADRITARMLREQFSTAPANAKPTNLSFEAK